MEKSNVLATTCDRKALTKSEQRTLAEVLINKVKDGEVDPLVAYTQAKGMIEALTMFVENDDVISIAANQCEYYGKEGIVIDGVKVTTSEVGVKYDYNGCAPDLDEMLKLRSEMEASFKESVADLDESIKDKKKQLLGLKGDIKIVDEETGELVTWKRPEKVSGRMGIKCSFK